MLLDIMRVLATLYSEKIYAYSAPHHDCERQRSVNNFWICIIGTLSCKLLQTVLNSELAAFMRHIKSEMLPAV
jgi:hypothetical protein